MVNTQEFEISNLFILAAEKAHPQMLELLLSQFPDHQMSEQSKQLFWLNLSRSILDHNFNHHFTRLSKGEVVETKMNGMLPTFIQRFGDPLVLDSRHVVNVLKQILNQSPTWSGKNFEIVKHDFAILLEGLPSYISFMKKMIEQDAYHPVVSSVKTKYIPGIETFLNQGFDINLKLRPALSIDAPPDDKAIPQPTPLWAYTESKDMFAFLKSKNIEFQKEQTPKTKYTFNQHVLYHCLDRKEKIRNEHNKAPLSNEDAARTLLLNGPLSLDVRRFLALNSEHPIESTLVSKDEWLLPVEDQSIFPSIAQKHPLQRLFNGSDFLRHPPMVAKSYSNIQEKNKYVEEYGKARRNTNTLAKENFDLFLNGVTNLDATIQFNNSQAPVWAIVLCILLQENNPPARNYREKCKDDLNTSESLFILLDTHRKLYPNTPPDREFAQLINSIRYPLNIWTDPLPHEPFSVLEFAIDNKMSQIDPILFHLDDAELPAELRVKCLDYKIRILNNSDTSLNRYFLHTATKADKSIARTILNILEFSKWPEDIHFDGFLKKHQIGNTEAVENYKKQKLLSDSRNTMGADIQRKRRQAL